MDKSADAYRTISEVAEELKLPQHVLRFWETRFPQIKPMKRGGNRRFYRPEDVELLRAIRAMLYGEGYTIKGVQRILKQQGPRVVAGLGQARPKRPAGRGGSDVDPAAADHGRVDADEEPRPVHLPQRVAADAGLGAARMIEPDLRGLRADVMADLPDAGSERPVPEPAGYASYKLAERLQAVLYDIAECERLLAATRD